MQTQSCKRENWQLGRQDEQNQWVQGKRGMSEWRWRRSVTFVQPHHPTCTHTVWEPPQETEGWWEEGRLKQHSRKMSSIIGGIWLFKNINKINRSSVRIIINQEMKLKLERWDNRSDTIELKQISVYYYQFHANNQITYEKCTDSYQCTTYQLWSKEERDNLKRLSVAN